MRLHPRHGPGFSTPQGWYLPAIAVLMMVGLPLACDSPPSAAPLEAAIVGQVVDFGTGAPLVGAQVKTTPSTTSVQTNAQGKYEIRKPNPGAYTVEASSAGYVTATTAIQVHAGEHVTADLSLRRFVPVAAVIVAPGSGTMAPATARTFTATVRDGSGNVLTDRTVSWSSSNSSVVSLSAGTGASTIATALGAGSSTIRAICEGIIDSAVVTVIPGTTVASVTITGLAQSIAVNASVQLSATPIDASGKPIVGRVTVWSSGSPGVATVSSTGLVVGVASGTAEIRATVDGVTGSVQVTVTPPVATIRICCGGYTVVSGILQLSASLASANGQPIFGRRVTWTSAAPAIMAVTDAGLVVGLATGDGFIRASADGVTGEFYVVVTTNQIILRPTFATLTVGQTATLTGTYYFFQAPTAYTWFSSNDAVLAVSQLSQPNNVVRAVGVGTAVVSVQVSADGRSGWMGSAVISVVSAAAADASLRVPASSRFARRAPKGRP